MSNLEKLKNAIATREGFYKPGTVPRRLHNPGDLVFAHQSGAAACDIQGEDGKIRTYARFSDDAAGWAALERQIRLDASRGLTLKEFIWKYAPGSDGNDPGSYLAGVMRAIGVSAPNTPLAAVIAGESGAA